MTKPMQIVDVNVNDLKEADYNPRQLTATQAQNLSLSLTTFGLVEPLVVNNFPGRENVVIGGHQRLRLAKQACMATVPVVYVSLPLEKEKELNLRLNSNLGEWDVDKLTSEFDNELLALVGFSTAREVETVERDAAEAVDGHKYSVVIECEDELDAQDKQGRLEVDFGWVSKVRRTRPKKGATL